MKSVSVSVSVQSRLHECIFWMLCCVLQKHSDTCKLSEYVVKERNPSVCNCNVAAVNCDYVFRLFQSNHHRAVYQKCKKEIILHGDRGQGACSCSLHLLHESCTSTNYILLLCVLVAHRRIHNLNLRKGFLSYFYRCTVHLEGSLSITHQQMH